MKRSGKRVFTLQFAFQSGNLYCIAPVHDEAEASYRELTQRSSSVIARVRPTWGKKRGESKTRGFRH